MLLCRLSKTLSKLPAGIEYVERRSNGDIAIHCTPGHQDIISHLQKVKKINGVGVQFILPEEANLLKGVISHPEIKLLSEE